MQKRATATYQPARALPMQLHVGEVLEEVHFGIAGVAQASEVLKLQGRQKEIELLTYSYDQKHR